MPKNLNSRGIIHLSIPILIAIVGVIAFLLFSSSASFKNGLFSYLFPKPPSHAAEINTVTIDGSLGTHPISPLIYGISESDGVQPYQKVMGVSISRSGGNQMTRSNWEGNFSNAGSDWGLCSGKWSNLTQAGGSTVPGKVSYDFISGNKTSGADSILTIPLIGWVAKDGNNNNCSTGVPASGGFPVTPGSEAIAGYDPAANRAKTSLPAYPKKGSAFSYPPNTTDGKVYMDEWVNYLVSQFGNAQNGGVKFYSMDNEYDLWDSTHLDIHPVHPTYDEIWNKIKDYAEGIKAVDPGAQITAPVGWGFMSMLNSSDGWAGGADRVNHGNLPLYQWLLRQAKQYETANSKRLLDVLDIHYYPQEPRTPGVGQIQFPGATDAATNAYRLRSVRSLWDPTYNEESWMIDLETGPNIRFIPRLKEMINQEYPGTKLAITEYNWGAEGHINGALALADILGVFGREGLDIATYWTSPADGSPAYWAFRMFRNVDGAFAGFGDTSIQAQQNNSDLDKFSAYASKDSKTNETKVMLINKDPNNAQTITLNIANITGGGSAKVYQYSKVDTTQIKRLADLTNVNIANYNYNMPAYSTTLLILDPNVAPGTDTGAPPPTPPSPTPTPSPAPPLYVYNDSLDSNWDDWSWGVGIIDYANTTNVHSGTNSIAWSSFPWGGLNLHSNLLLNTSPYQKLHFAMYGASATHNYTVTIQDLANVTLGTVNLDNYGGQPVAGSWKVYDIPLTDLNAVNKILGNIQIANFTQDSQPTVYIDDLSFIPPQMTPPPGSKQGDINGDNKVDIIDLSILLSNWLSTDPSSDINKDGKVSIIDLSILLSNWLK